MTIINCQSNIGARKVGNRLRGVGVIALGWVVFLGCAADLDRNRDYSWALEGNSGGSDQGGSNSGQGGSGNPQGGTSGMVTAPADPSCLTAMITDKACTSCHGSSADLIGAHLDLSKPNIGQRLLNKASDCATNPPLIDGSNLMNSLFLKKVSNVATGCNGTAMPPGSTGLAGDQLQCVKDWLASFH